MRILTRLFGVTFVAAAFAGSASAQSFSTPLRPGFPTPPAPKLPSGVRPVPTTPPSFVPVQPRWPGVVPPLPYPTPLPPPVVDIDYKVYYRVGCVGPWTYYGRAENLRQARFVERQLEAQGYEVNLIETFGRGPGGWHR